MEACPDAAELDAFVAGAAGEADRARITAHLARCDECRELVSVLAPVSVDIDPTLPSASAEAELLPGQVLDGKYEIERVIGAGGMGLVARARHRVLGTHVVVKLVRAVTVDDTTLRRFLREARASAAIESEHVVRVLDAGTTPRGRPYLVLEHLEGRDLAAELAARGRIPVEEAVHYVMQACEALAVAHARGIVHRDIKPANLFLTRAQNGAPLIKVLDFGIAKAAEDSGLATVDTALTDTGTIMGSPRYMSPEQLEHSAGADARSDVWALGVVLHELIAGVPPFDGPNVAALVSGILTREPAPLTGAPPALASVVLLCLNKKRDQRIQNVEALARALAPFAPDDVGTLAERIERAAQSQRARGPRRRVALAIAAAATVGAAAWLWPRAQPSRVERVLLTPVAGLSAAPAPAPVAPAPRPETSSRVVRHTHAAPSVAPSPAPPASSAPAPSDIHRDGLLDRK